MHPMTIETTRLSEESGQTRKRGIMPLLLLISLLLGMRTPAWGQEVLEGSSYEEPPVIVLTATRKGEVLVNNIPTRLENLEAVLRPMLAARPGILVTLTGEKDVVEEQAVKILSAAQRAGATRIAIAAPKNE